MAQQQQPEHRLPTDAGTPRPGPGAEPATRATRAARATTSTQPPRDRAAHGYPGSSTVVSGGTARASTADEPDDAHPARGSGAATARRAVDAGEVLGEYLRGQATAFLRGLSLRGVDDAAADALLRGSARRIGGVVHTYGALVDAGWAETLGVELGWLSTTLEREPQYAGRLVRLSEALRRLSDAPAEPVLSGVAAGPAARTAPPALALGAARAAALLERQLTLARTRAHSASLQALGSARFHALADAIAVLASEVPLTAEAQRPAKAVLPPLAAQALQRLADACAALPLRRAAHPYNAEAVRAALGPELTADLQDAPWHQVRILLRLSRYAAEVPGAEADEHRARRLAEAAAVLRRHREAAESAAAVASAARTPRIAPATAYALGVLHADQRHEVEAARFTFSRLWEPHAVPAPVPGPVAREE